MAQALDLTGLDVNKAADARGIQNRISSSAQELYRSIALPEAIKPEAQPRPAGGAPSSEGSTFAEMMAIPEGTEENLSKEYDTNFMDYVHSFVSGSHNLLGAVGGAANWLGGLFNDDEKDLNLAQSWGRELAEHQGGLSEDRLEKLSDDAKELMNLKFLPDEKPGSAIGSIRSLMLKFAQTAPSFAATIGPVGLAAKGGAGLATLAKMTAAQRAKTIAIASGVTGAATEGTLAVGFTANEIYDHVENLSPEELAQTPSYDALKAEKLSDKEIRDAIAADAIRWAGAFSGVSSAVTGGIGGALLGKIFKPAEATSRRGRMGRAAITEGVQEYFQEAGEQVGVNIGVKNEVDPNQALLEGTGEAGVAGAVMGGPAGAVFAAPGGTTPSNAPPVDPNTDPTQAPPPATDTPDMAGQAPPHVPPEQAAPVEGVPNPAVPDAQENAVPEPPEQLAAQIQDMLSGDTTRKSVYISPSNLKTDEQQQAIWDWVDAHNEAEGDQETIRVHPDAKGGILLSTDPEAIKAYEKEHNWTKPASSKLARDLGLTENHYDKEDPRILQKLLGYTQSKEEAGVAEGTAAAVVSRDEEGNVLKEEAVSPDQVEAVVQKHRDEGYKNIEVKSAGEAVAQRVEAVEGAAPTPAASGEAIPVTQPAPAAPASGQQKSDKVAPPKATPAKQSQEQVATTTTAKPQEPVAPKATPKEKAAARRKNVETFLNSNPKNQAKLRDLAEEIREYIDHQSHAKDREGWMKTLSDIETAVNKNTDPTGKDIAGKIVEYFEGKTDAKTNKIGKELVEDLATTEDVGHTLEAVKRSLRQPKLKEGDFTSHKQTVAEEAATRAAIDKARAGLTDIQKAKEHYDLWVEKTKNPGKTKKGGTLEALPVRSEKKSAVTHAEFGPPIIKFIRDAFQDKTALVNKMSDAERTEVSEFLADKGITRIGKDTEHNGKKIREAIPRIGEILDKLESYDKREAPPSKPTKQKKPEVPKSAPQQSAKPAPKRPAEPAKASAESSDLDPEVVKLAEQLEAKAEADKKAKAKAEKVKAAAKAAAEKKAKAAERKAKAKAEAAKAVAAAKAKAEAESKKGAVAIRFEKAPGKKEKYNATSEGLEVTFSTENQSTYTKAYLWRPKGKTTFNISVLVDGEVEVLETDFKVLTSTKLDKAQQLKPVLQMSGIEPLVDQYGEKTQVPEGGFPPIADDLSLGDLTSDPAYAALVGQRGRAVRGLIKEAVRAEPGADLDQAITTLRGSLVAAGLEPQAARYEELARLANAKFNTARDALPEQGYGEEVSAGGLLQAGMGIELDREAKRQIKNTDKRSELLARLESEHGEAGAAEILNEIDADVREYRQLARENAPKPRTQEEKADLNAAIDQDVKAFKEQRYDELLGQLRGDIEIETMEGGFDYRMGDEEVFTDDTFFDDRGAGLYDGHFTDNSKRKKRGRKPSIRKRARKVANLRRIMSAEDALKAAGLPYNSTATFARAFINAPGQSPHLVALMKRLNSAGFEVPIIFNPDLDVQGVATQAVFETGKFADKPDPRLSVIEINPSVLEDGQHYGEDFLNTFIHEWVHILTIAKMENNPNLLKEIRNLMLLTQNYKGNKEFRKDYGFTDEYEFVAEALSNPEFQWVLQNTPLEEIYGASTDLVKQRVRNLWRKFVQLISDVLGVGDKLEYNALEYAMSLSNEAIMSRKEIDALYGKESARGGKVESHFHRHLAPRTKAEARERGRQLREFGTRGLLHAHTMDQIVRRFKTRFNKDGENALTKYYHWWQKQQGIVSSELRKASKLVTAWGDLTRSDPDAERAMNELMLDSTLYEIDPTVPTSNSTDANRVRLHDELHARYGKLTPAAKEVFDAAAKYYKQELVEKEEFTIESFLQAADKFSHRKDLNSIARRLRKVDIQAKDKYRNILKTSSRNQLTEEEIDDLVADISRIRRLMDKQRRGLYFPVSREGDNVVKAKKVTKVMAPSVDEAKKWKSLLNTGQQLPNGQTFQEFSNVEIDPLNKGRLIVTEEVYATFESLEEAQQYADDLELEMGDVVEGPLTKKKEEIPQLTGALVKLSDRIKKNLPGSAYPVDAAVIQLLAEDSVRKTMLRRRGVTGARPMDMRKNFANRVRHNAWVIADLKTSLYKQKALNEMRETADKHPDRKTRTMLGRVVNHIHFRETQNFGFRGDHFIADKVSRAGYMMALASPSYSLINMSQVPLVTFPVLAAEHGAGKATAALYRNMREVTGGGQLLQELGKTKGGLKGLPINFIDELATKWGVQAPRTTTDRVNIEDVQTKGDMLAALSDINAIDSSFIQSIYESANMADTKFDRGYEIATMWAKSWPQFVEQINRAVTAGAEYDLQIAKGVDPVTATRAAHEAIVKTHGDYSDSNKPAVFKIAGGWSKVIFMFKAYSQFISALYVQNIAASLGKGDKGRREGIQALMYLTMTHTAAAGVMGGIITQPVRMLAAALLGAWDDDEPLYLEDGVETILLKLAGGDEELAEILSRGLARGIGIDAFSRVGLHNIWMMPHRANSSEAEIFGHYLEQLLGPSASFAKNIYKGSSTFINGGDVESFIKGLQQGAPKAIKDLIKAIKYSEEGVTDKSGVPILPADQYGFGSAVTQAIGFAPASAARAYEKSGATIRYEMTLSNRSQELRLNWYNAKTREDKSEALKAILAFNRKNPGQYHIKPSSLTRGVKTRRETEFKRSMGMYSRDPYTGTQLEWATK